MAIGYSKRHETRRIHFNINSGLAEIIGRASAKDKNREASVHNLYFQEKSLSKRHAVLNVKKFGSIEGYEEDDYDKIYENIRIYVEDLDSTHGIVDLQSNVKEMSNIIDIKNGERFGVVFMPQPITCQQARGARLKFQVNVAPLHGDIWELVVRDVTYDDSPCTTKGGAVEEYGRSSTHVLADSCSDWNSSERWYDEKVYGTLGDSTDSSKLSGGENSILESKYDLLLENESTEENNSRSLASNRNVGRAGDYLGTSITSIEKEGLEIVDSFMEKDDSYELLSSKPVTCQNTGPSIWEKKPILVSTVVGSVVGFVVGFVVGAATLE